MTKITYIFSTVSAEALVPAWGNASVAHVKPQSGGHSQNGQAVEYGQPLFIVG
ncbi:MAG: hypothetical protein PHT15_08550 [Gallionellaceae bacterium]|nr:hypothetical protein [Gallionellaceae bacterium]